MGGVRAKEWGGQGGERKGEGWGEENMHVFMPVAQGSSKVLIYSCAPVAERNMCAGLCSCTLCEGIHAQAISRAF